MVEKKLSRRDAVKVLGAALGAVALANLPPEWSKPEIAAGTLPAHAQASTTTSVITCAPDWPLLAGVYPFTSDWIFMASILPARNGVSLQYQISATPGRFTQTNPPGATGTVTTDNSGHASVTVQGTVTGAPCTIQVMFSFLDPADGTGSCTQSASFI
jgi:hypothetical protein